MSAPETNIHQLYSGQLAERFIKKFNKRRKYLSTRYQPKSKIRRPFTIGGIAHLSGMPYDTVRCHLSKRDRTMGFDDLDRYLCVTGMSVLELIQPHEMLAYLQSLDSDVRQMFNSSMWLVMKKRLDKASEVESNEASGQSEDSQLSPSDEPDKPATSNTQPAPKKRRR